MLRSAAASWTLFFGLLLIMAGNGLQVVLLGVEAKDSGFSNMVTGFVMAGYFLGIFFGSILVPKLLNNVGHVRVFGAMSALASAAVLVIALFFNPLVWAMMRILTGFSFAGMYIVCESWLNDKSTNETRGQMLSLYMIISMGGMGIGQMLVGFGDEQSVGLFLLASVMVSVAVVPILLTAGAAPGFEAPERMSIRRLVQVSPLAVVGLAINGVAVSMMFGMGAVYGRSIGMDTIEIGYFMTAPMLGALLLQYPVGRLSDRFDRRLVILSVSIMGGIAAGCATLFGQQQFGLLLLCMLIYGGALFPSYSLCIAHANDFLTPSQMVAAASGLVMVNGVGAVLGSPLAALAIEYLGVGFFFVMIAGVQVVMVCFVLFRMSRRTAVPNEAQGPFVAIPESGSAVVATLNPEAQWIPSGDEVTEEEDPFHDNPYIN